MLVVVLIWGLLGFGVPVLVAELLGAGRLEAATAYFVVALAVPVALLVLVLRFCARQEDIDRNAGVADHY